MAKLVLDDIAALQNFPSSTTAINNNSGRIEAAIENTLSRDGTSPNQMESVLDMNSNRIINLPAPTEDGDVVRLQDLEGILNTTVDLTLAPLFDTVLEVQSAEIPNILVSYIEVAGYSSVGDGGKALYKRVLLEPIHEGKIQSLDGSWWEIAEQELVPEMFGAKADDWNYDNSTALSKLQSVVSALDLPIALNGIYATTATLTFSNSDLNIKGNGHGTGFAFRDCDGIRHIPSVAGGIHTISNLAILTNSNRTRIGFYYSGIAGASNGWSNHQNTLMMGEDAFRNPSLGASSRFNGWLDHIKLEDGRRIRISSCRVQGAEADRFGDINTIFPVQTNGINVNGCNHVYLEDCFVFLCHTGMKVRGAGENHEISRGAFVANKRGVDMQASSGALNDHNIIGVHIASYEFNVDLYGDASSSTSDSVMHNVNNCLLFSRGEISTPNFIHIRTKSGGADLSGNYFYAEAGDADAVATNHTSVSVVSGSRGVRVSDCYFHSQNIIVQNEGSFTYISGNHTVDASAALSVTPVQGSGTNVRLGPNTGDRESLWGETYIGKGAIGNSGAFVIRGAPDAGTAASIESASGNVNSIRLVAGNTTVNPMILPNSGGDANIGLNIRSRGTGRSNLQNAGGTNRISWGDQNIGFFDSYVSARTGWTPATGTADRTAYATYTAPTISGTYTQAEVQALANHVQVLSQHLKAVIDDLHQTAGYGLLRT